jgi:GT2 family glycosyltransferase
MNAPTIAVVIPVHNGERYLGAALASVAAQSLPPREVIVVDDGSTDGSADVAARAGARVLRQSNAGPGAARNAGVAVSESEWIAFLDADDVFLPDRLARQVAALRAQPAAIGVCSDALCLGGPRDGQRKLAGAPLPPRLVFTDLLRSNPVIASSVLVQRAALLRAGGFDADRVLIATEDYDLWLRLLAAPGSCFAYVDAPLVQYRVHAGSLSDPARFLAGIDRIMAKVCAARPDDAAVAAAAARRRSGTRLDAAWACLQRGERWQARALLAQARALSGWSWKGAKMWLRSWL